MTALLLLILWIALERGIYIYTGAPQSDMKKTKVKIDFWPGKDSTNK